MDREAYRDRVAMDDRTPLLTEEGRNLRRYDSFTSKLTTGRTPVLVKRSASMAAIGSASRNKGIFSDGEHGHTTLRSTLRVHSHRFCAKVYRWFIAVLILVNVVAFVISTDQGFSDRFGTQLGLLEGVSSVIFLVEYLLRLYLVPEFRRYRAVSPTRARIRWMLSFESIVDFLAFMPWFAEYLTVEDLQLPNLTPIRLLRVFRLLKSAPVVGAFDVVARVLYYNAEILCVACLICAVLLLATSTVLFYLRPGTEVESGGEVADFSSIPATMYLAIMMLTGQGGPEGVLPWYTKAVVTVTAFFSVAQFAIPASMLTWGFEMEAQRRVKRQKEERKVQVQRLKQGLPACPISSSSSSENSTDSEWEEYEAEIAGDESDEDNEGAPPNRPEAPKFSFDGLPPSVMGRAARVFSVMDADESGFIDTKELQGMISPGKPLGKDILDIIDGNRDGKTTSEEFFTWLMTLKRQNDSKVFYLLLRDLEDRAQEIKMRDKVSKAPSGTKRGSAGSSSNVVSQQQMARITDILLDLQQEIVGLKDGSQRMEQEIKQLKQSARVV